MITLVKVRLMLLKFIDLIVQTDMLLWTKTISLLSFFVLCTWILTTRHVLLLIVAKKKHLMIKVNNLIIMDTLLYVDKRFQVTKNIIYGICW